MFHMSDIHREVTNISLVSAGAKREGTYCDVLLRGNIISQLPKLGTIATPARQVFYTGLQIVDEDGVECFSSRFEFMLSVAQAAGFDYADLGDLEVLAPRSMKPTSATKDQRWDLYKRFAVVKSDQAFRSLMLRWARIDSKEKRIQNLRARAFDDLIDKLTQKSASTKQTYKDAVAGAAGIWRLALNQENEGELLEKNALAVILQLLEDYAINEDITANPFEAAKSKSQGGSMSPYIRRKSLADVTTGLSEVCFHLAGAFWAIVSSERVRKALSSELYARACCTALRVLYSQPTTNVANAPSTAGCTKLTAESPSAFRVYTLDSLRCLLHEPFGQNFLYDSSRWLQEHGSPKLLASVPEVDVLLFLSTALRWAKSTTVQTIVCNVISRILSETSVISFFAGTPSKRMQRVVQDVCYLLNSAAQLVDSKQPSPPGIAVRLSAVTLLAKFAYHSKESRQWLIASEHIVGAMVETLNIACERVFTETWEEEEENSSQLIDIFRSITGGKTPEIPDAFDETEWPLTKERAFDSMLLSSVAVLWGVAAAIEESANSQIEMSDKAIRSLCAVVVCSRYSPDPRPAAELVAISTLSAIARSKKHGASVLSFIPAMKKETGTSPQLAERILVERMRERAGSSREELNQIFRQLDTGGNEIALDIVEFSRAFRKLDVRGFTREHVKYLFEKYDADKSGEITPSEFIDGLEASWQDLLRTESNLPVVLVDSLMGTSTLWKTVGTFRSDEAEVCGLSALCGALRVCIHSGFSPFCMFPKLDLNHLMERMRSAKGNFANLLQKLSSTAIMLFCQSDADDDIIMVENEVWTMERMEKMLSLLATFSDKVTFEFQSSSKQHIKRHISQMSINRYIVVRIAMGIWALANMKETRAKLLESQAIPTFLKTIKGYVRWFSLSSSSSKTKTRRVIYPSFTIQKMHECLNLILKPLMLILRDRDFILNSNTKDEVERCIYVLVDVLKTAVLPYCSQENSSDHAACLNQIGGKNLDAFWSLGKEESFDDVIFSSMSLLTIRDVSLNTGIFPPCAKKQHAYSTHCLRDHTRHRRSWLPY